MISFALYSIKGGVGKTTSCVNLAHLAAKDGFSTLLWDLDHQSAATYYIGEKSSINGSVKDLLNKTETLPEFVKPSKYKNLSYIPGHMKNRHSDILLNDLKGSKKHFKKIISSVKSNFDYLFLDCPPTLNLLAENLFKAADFILVPIVPSALSERTYDQLFEFFQKEGLDLRKIVPFFSLVDLRRKVHLKTMEAFRATKPKILNNKIPNLSQFEEMGEEKAPVSAFSYNSRASYAYRSLWQELKSMQKLKSRKSLEASKNEFGDAVFRR
ncbi:MAG: chromosome partitioning protein [Paraglaciecola sp.]|jgi:chromosome partitioning protein